MPKKVPPLTSSQIKNVKPKEREFSLADGDGLYLRIKPTGIKCWIFNYQVPFTSKRTNLSFGTFPIVSLADARRERDLCRTLLTKEVDPKTARSERNNILKKAHANTLESVSEQWFSVKSHEISEDYASDIWNSLENHLFPRLGHKPVHKLIARDLIDTLRPLQDAGKLELVKRLCQRINMVMDYAVITGLLEDNRLTRIGKAFKAPKKQHLPSIKPEEVSKLVSDIEEANIHNVTRYLILWQLHTMVRPSEASGAKWVELDLENRVWKIPPERMKKRREHVVPLTKHTMQIVQELTPFSGHREFMFPSRNEPRRPMNSATVNMALRRMGYKNRLVSHGMRSIASTALHDRGYDSEIVEVSLAHVDKNQTRAAYNRSDFLEKRREMLEWWSNFVEAGVDANE